MSTKKTPRGASVSNSFSRAQVKGLNRLFQAARAGADIKLMLQTPALVELQAKFQKMEARAEELAAEMKSEGNARRANMDAATGRAKSKLLEAHSGNNLAPKILPPVPVRGNTEPENEPPPPEKAVPPGDGPWNAYGLARRTDLTYEEKRAELVLRGYPQDYIDGVLKPGEPHTVVGAPESRRCDSITVTVARARFGTFPQEHVTKICKKIAERVQASFTCSSVAVCVGDTESVEAVNITGGGMRELAEEVTDIIGTLWEATKFEYVEERVEEDEKPTSLEEDGEAAAEDMSNHKGFGDDDAA